MNEVERSSQVSALFDGELDPTQSDLVTRRLLKDPATREQLINAPNTEEFIAALTQAELAR